MNSLKGVSAAGSVEVCLSPRPLEDTSARADWWAILWVNSLKDVLAAGSVEVGLSVISSDERLLRADCPPGAVRAAVSKRITFRVEFMRGKGMKLQKKSALKR